MPGSTFARPQSQDQKNVGVYQYCARRILGKLCVVGKIFVGDGGDMLCNLENEPGMVATTASETSYTTPQTTLTLGQPSTVCLYSTKQTVQGCSIVRAV